MAMERREMCERCSMDLMEVHKILMDEGKLLDFLQLHGVLSIKPPLCPTCNTPCKLYPADSFRFRCTNRILSGGNKRKKGRREPCNFKVGLKKGTFFEKAHLPWITICKFVFYWLGMKPKQEWMMHELSLTSNTVVNWANFCREVCLISLIDNSEKIGGEGVVVEIDECKMDERKYNRGRIVDGQWIFGGIERCSKKIFLVPVEERSKEHLLTVINRWILPGTTIISECWKAYDCLADKGFKHQNVKYSKNFVDPETGARTKNFEGAWRDMRSNVPKFGLREAHCLGYLAEHLFRRKFSNHRDLYHDFFKNMGQVYPPSNNGDEQED